MRGGGRTIDLDAVAGLTTFLAEGGVDGMLACGTTGEGVLLEIAERRAVAEAFVSSAPSGFRVAVHAGAQTSADTITLAAHAQEIGADAVAVIAPPYFPLDADELTKHLVGAANAADPLPFYVYEFAGRSGYAIPPSVVTRVAQAAPNVVGLKVSDTPFEAVEPYLGLGLDVLHRLGTAHPRGHGRRRGRQRERAWRPRSPRSRPRSCTTGAMAAHDRVRRLREGSPACRSTRR